MSKSTTETGHAINVENFSDLINFCIGLGSVYNPTNNAIKLTSLQTKLSSARNSLTVLNHAHANFINKVNARQEAFKILKLLITRIINALDASDVNDNIVNDARTYVRKLRGSAGSTKKLKDVDNPVSSISNIQMSFDMRIENFDKLVSLLSTVENYNPNETDLAISSLQNFLQELRIKNREYSEALVAASISRNFRNVHLYDSENGLLRNAKEVKKYVKSVYGPKAEEFTNINGIRFKKIKM